MKVYVEGKGGIASPRLKGDAGYDLRSAVSGSVDAGRVGTFDTGVHVELPQGHCGLIVGRSGMNVSGKLSILGLVDSEYRGSIRVALHNTQSVAPIEVTAGDRIAQLIIIPYITPNLEFVETAEALSDTARGANGFGSTGST